MGIDLKNPEAVELVLRLVEQADGLVEGFRPGVAERLGLGPEACRARNRALVYGRMTGWGQEGPLAAEGRPRHRLHRHRGRPVADRPGRFGAGAAAEPGGRLRGRGDAARVRHGVGVAGGGALGPGPGRRCGHGRRGGHADDDDPLVPRCRHVERRAGREHARHRRAVLRGLRDGRPEVPRARGDRAAVLRRAPRGPRAGRRPPLRRAERQGELAGHEGAGGRGGRHQDAGRVGRPSSTGPTPASPRSSRRGRPRSIRTTRPGRPSSRSTARVQPAPAPRFSRTPSSISRPPSVPGGDTVSGLLEWGIEEGTVAKLRETGALS